MEPIEHTLDEEPGVARPASRGPVAGMRFEQYELIRELGRGGMGAVFLARDVRLGRRVAVKFLSHDKSSLADRFRAEARATAQCKHDHIVDIYDGLDYSPGKRQSTERIVSEGFRLPNVYTALSGSFYSGSTALPISTRIYQDCVGTVGKIDKTIKGYAGAGAVAGAIGGAVTGGLVGAIRGGIAGGAAGAVYGAKVVGKNSYSYVNPDARCDGVEGIGWVPQVLSLESLSFKDVHSLKDFEADLTAPYDQGLTFIEPHYGNLGHKTYKGGSSQHSKDGVYGGEALIKFVYDTLRNSPIWNTSLLIITYDEHGGFYDSVAPPGDAIPPGNGNSKLTKYGFGFDQYGVRVPAVVVSPTVPKNKVNNTLFDHSSIPATLSAAFSMPPLTDRDTKANSVLQLCTLSIDQNNLNTGTPTTLPDPVPDNPSAASSDEASASASLAEPLPESGNLIGVLNILLKEALKLSDGSPESQAAIREEFDALKTRGDAAAFAKKVWIALGRDLE